MAQSVRDFVDDAYQLVTPNSPTVALHGDDLSRGIKYLNQLIKSYSGTGLLQTIAKEVTTTLSIGQSLITFADASYLPAADVQQGRLANLQDAWLLLDGVTYPLVDESRNVFQGSYKYDPQLGLPRFAIIYNQVDITTMRVYPGASQVYELHVYGKFELPLLTSNSDMSGLPTYYLRFLQLALARELCFYKGRSSAWTPDLKEMYIEARMDMESVSSVNLVIQNENESLLNGAWRVRAGV